MTVVTLHPVVVHLKGVLRGLLIVDVYLSVFYFQLVTFIGADRTLVDGQILQRQVDGLTLGRNPDGSVVVARPVHVSTMSERFFKMSAVLLVIGI